MSEGSAGLCGQFFSLSLGSVDNTRRFEGNASRLAVALPEIYCPFPWLATAWCST